MTLSFLGLDNHIIHIHLNFFVHHIMKQSHHGPLVGGPCILQPEWHNIVTDFSPGYNNGCFLIIFKRHDKGCFVVGFQVCLCCFINFMNSLILFSSYSSFSLSSRHITKCFFKYKSKSFGILQNYCKIHAIYFFKKNMPKYFKSSPEKNVQIIFSHMQEKENILFFYIFQVLVWQKLIFLYNKTTKNRPKRCLSNILFNQKNPLTKIWQIKQGLKPLT